MQNDSFQIIFTMGETRIAIPHSGSTCLNGYSTVVLDSLMQIEFYSKWTGPDKSENLIALIYFDAPPDI
jgi:hypothetical protein